MLRERQNHAWLVHVEGGLVCAGALRVGVVNGLVSDAFHACICRANICRANSGFFFLLLESAQPNISKQLKMNGIY